MSDSSKDYSGLFSRLTRLLIIIGLVAGFIYLLPKLEEIFTLTVISLLLYALLVPLVNNFESKGVPRPISIIIVYLIGLALVGFAFNVIIPPMIEEAQSLKDAIQNEGPQRVLEGFEARLKAQFPTFDTSVITDRLGSIMSEALQRGVSVVFGIVSVMTSLMIVLFMTFFFLKDQREIKKTIIGMIPNRYFEMSLVLVYKIEKQLSNYIRGVLLDGSVVALLSSIGLYMLDLPFFYFVGIVAGLTNMIPYMGPIIGATVAIIVALMTDPTNFSIIGWIAGLFAVVQLIDNILVTPYVVSNAVDLHPLVVMIAVLIGGSLMGTIGLIFAVPMTSVIKVTIEEVMRGLKSYRLV